MNIDNVILKYINLLRSEMQYIYSKYPEFTPEKYALIVNNDENAKKLLWEREATIAEFEEEMFSTPVLSYSPNLAVVVQSLLEDTASQDYSEEIKYLLNEILNNWECTGTIIYGELDEHSDKGYNALKYFLKLPGFDPEAWLRRNLVIQPILIPDTISHKIEKSVLSNYEEAYKCFIYVFFSAVCAL
jgi:hypothetical protein